MGIDIIISISVTLCIKITVKILNKIMLDINFIFLHYIHNIYEKSLYFKYNSILSFEDEKAGKTYSKNKIRMGLPLIFPSLGLGLRSLIDFNFTELVITMLFYAPSATAQVNYLLDFSKPVISSSLVIDKHIDTGSKTPDTYILTVNLKNGKQCDLKISKAYYEKVEPGRTVQISEKTGFLKIKYASVNEE